MYKISKKKQLSNQCRHHLITWKGLEIKWIHNFWCLELHQDKDSSQDNNLTQIKVDLDNHHHSKDLIKEDSIQIKEDMEDHRIQGIIEIWGDS